MNLKNVSFALIFLFVVGMALTGMFRKSNEPEGVIQTAVVDSKLEAEVPVEENGFTPILDEQGAVTVEVTPLNLENASETLDFEVTLNTHSVDLSMNLATLATLTTDTGIVIQAITWDAPLGGHHVSGTLSFPAFVDGVSVLEGATQFTLTIVGVDAPERVFVWTR